MPIRLAEVDISCPDNMDQHSLVHHAMSNTNDQNRPRDWNWYTRYTSTSPALFVASTLREPSFRPVPSLLLASLTEAKKETLFQFLTNGGMESWISGVFSVCMTKLREFFVSVWLDILTEGSKNGSTNLKITKAHCIYLSGIQKWTPITSTLRQLYDVMQRWWLQSPNLWLNMSRQVSKHVLRICRIILSSQPKQRPCNHQRFKHLTSQKLSLRREGQWYRKSQVRVYVCVCAKISWVKTIIYPTWINLLGGFSKLWKTMLCAYESLQESSPLPLIRFKGFFWLGALPELGQQPTCFQLQEHLPEDPHHLQVLQAFGSRVGGWSTDFRKQIGP